MNESLFISLRRVLPLAVLGLSLMGCSSYDDAEAPPMVEENEDVQIEAVDLSSDNTRTTYGTALETFSVYAYKAAGAQADNVLYKKVSGAWTVESGTFRWPANTVLMNLYAMSPSSANLTNINFSMAGPCTFDREVENVDPTMTKVASRISISKKSTGGKIQLSFANALGTLKTTAVNRIDKVTVIISEIKFHNIANLGRFTFDASTISKGTWELLKSNHEVYVEGTDNYKDVPVATYGQPVDEPVTLASNKYLSIIKEEMFIMPQTVKAWVPTKDADGNYMDDENNSIYTADQNHLAYIEVKCRIIGKDDLDNDYYMCGWSDEDNAADPDNKPKFESVYFPYNSAKYKFTFNKSTTYKLDFMDPLNSLGGPYKGHTGMDEFITNEWIEVQGDDVDDWTDDENGTIQIEM